MHDFTQDTDEMLVDYWNDRDGAVSWLVALEGELNCRRYQTRDSNGQPRFLAPVVAEDSQPREP